MSHVLLRKGIVPAREDYLVVEFYPDDSNGVSRSSLSRGYSQFDWAAKAFFEMIKTFNVEGKILHQGLRAQLEAWQGCIQQPPRRRGSRSRLSPAQAEALRSLNRSVTASPPCQSFSEFSDRYINNPVPNDPATVREMMERLAVPANLDQAADRIHRPGTSAPVHHVELTEEALSNAIRTIQEPDQVISMDPAFPGTAVSQYSQLCAGGCGSRHMSQGFPAEPYRCATCTPAPVRPDWETMTEEYVDHLGVRRTERHYQCRRCGIRSGTRMGGCGCEEITMPAYDPFTDFDI